MFSRLAPLPVMAVFLLGALTACGGKDAAKDAPPKTAEDRFAIKVGDVIVQAQIAALPEELQRGLMFRQSMGRDEGMIFVFTSAQRMGFWMRNTTLPLDIGYFDSDGVLKEIYPMHPLDERTVSSRSRDIQFCLEMNQGWFKDRGVRPGVRLDLKALAAALRARGLQPETAGLRAEP